MSDPSILTASRQYGPQIGKKDGHLVSTTSGLDTVCLSGRGWRKAAGIGEHAEGTLPRHLGVVALVALVLMVACEPSDNRSTCAQCHAPVASDGTPDGIEDFHANFEVACALCHGGDPSGKTMEEAHVAPPAPPEGDEDNPSYPQSVAQIKRLAGLELDEVDPAYLRWVNPSDYRVTASTCGRSECHPTISETAPTSIMTTFAGHFNKTRYYAGTQSERTAEVGVRVESDTEFQPTQSGTVESLSPLLVDEPSPDAPFGDFVDHYLAKGCPRCHVGNFGSNNTDGDYRSSGCAGCHLVYSDTGLSQSGDPTISKDDPPHPIRHQATTAIPDNQCEHCHYRGNRIGTMYRGVREAGRIGDPENVEVYPDRIHGRSEGFYLVDEDTTNEVDETPPDLHFSAGLGCVDCHIGQDVHGTGRLYSAHDYQVGVECVDCHGSLEQPIAADQEGRFRTTAGNELKRVGQDADGFYLDSQLSGRRHRLVQIAELTMADGELAQAHGRDNGGFSHLDSMECYACHSSWTQSCFGCHVTVDLRSCGESKIDGLRTGGSVAGARSWVSLDYLALGIGPDDTITPMAPQEKMTFTVIADCDPKVQTCTDGVDGPLPGYRVYDQVVRHTADGKLGLGFGPVMPHTTSRGSQPCDRCHLRDDESNQDIIAETIGTGSGRFMMTDGAGNSYDLTQVVDEQGEATVGLGHEGTAVLPQSVVQRILTPRVPNSGLVLKQFPPYVSPNPPEPPAEERSSMEGKR